MKYMGKFGCGQTGRYCNELQPKPKVGHEEYFCRFSFRVQK